MSDDVRWEAALWDRYEETGDERLVDLLMQRCGACHKPVSFEEQYGEEGKEATVQHGPIEDGGIGRWWHHECL